MRGSDGARRSSGPARPSGTVAVSGGSLHPERGIVLISPVSGKAPRVRVPDDVVRVDLSPDGDRLAGTGFEGIWLMAPDGLSPRRILEEVVDASHPYGAGEIAWSPDGRRLVFARSGRSLCTMSADGQNQRRLVADADQPDWSPRGGQIVFVHHPETDAFSLHALDGVVCAGRVFMVPAGGSRARAYGPEIGDIGPRLSPWEIETWWRR